MYFTTDGAYSGWLLQRMMADAVITDGAYNRRGL